MTKRQERYWKNVEVERARARAQYRKHREKRLAAAKARHAANKESENARCRAYYARTYKRKSNRRSPNAARPLLKMSDVILIRNHEYRERELQAALEIPELRELIREQQQDDARRMIAKPWEISLNSRCRTEDGYGDELIDRIAA